MSQIKKIVFEYDDKVMETKDESEAIYLLESINGMTAFMDNRGLNPFNKKEVQWVTTIKEN